MKYLLPYIESYKSYNNLYVLKYNLEKYKTHKEKLMTNYIYEIWFYFRVESALTLLHKKNGSCLNLTQL